MRLELECRGVRLLACDESWLEKSLTQDPPESKRVVDLRKVNEISQLPSDALKEKSIQRVSIPVTAQSWSEQDMDTLRREFLRGDSPVVVISKAGKRAALMVLQHVARVQKWTPAQALEKCSEVAQDSQLRPLLEEYLTRHQRA